MQLKIELINKNAKLPQRAYAHDIGYDIFSAEDCVLEPGENKIISTGLKVEIPASHVILFWDKSGVAGNRVHAMGGVIDPGFRGEMKVNLINLGEKPYEIKIGQKIIQMLIQKVELPELIEAKIEDIDTERGEGMFGSSGLF